jgi:hypothetical protein
LAEWITFSAYMQTLYQRIIDKFLSKLANSKEFDETKIDQLRVLFSDSRKLRADDLAQVFSGTADDEIK